MTKDTQDLAARAKQFLGKHSVDATFNTRRWVKKSDAVAAVSAALSEAEKLREELARERELVGRLMSPVHIPNPVKRRDFAEEATRHD